MKASMTRICAAALLMAVIAAAPAGAWGPRTQSAIVTTAANLLSKSGEAPLQKLDIHIRAGAAAPSSEIEARYPGFAANPAGAVEMEMALLSSARRGRVDAYFAYRMGMLGKMICIVSAPMRDAQAMWREKYYEDADNAISGLQLRESARKDVEPQAYFDRLSLEIRANTEVIERQYQEGVGFKGVAATTFSADASRSVAAVADVWWTVLSSRAVQGGVSESQLRGYALDGLTYFIQRGNLQELDAALKGYAPLASVTADMRARIGDLLLAQGFEERAIKEYEAVIVEAPDRKDVVQKVADYYVRKGDESLRENRLEEARNAFSRAADSNPLHETAVGRRIEAENLIMERDSRMAAHQASLQRAGELRGMAEQEAGRSYFAEAVSFLQQAEAAYLEVTDEFPGEAQQRNRGLRDTRERLAQLKQSLKGNAMAFSGTGFGDDVKNLADNGVKGLEQEALSRMARRAYEAEMERLTQEMQPLFTLP